jgi:ferredoxin-type protein NapF
MSHLTRAQFMRGDWKDRPVSPSAEAFAHVLSGCLTHRGVFCRSCADDCEPAAIMFRPLVGAVARPTINPNRCTGCGDCRANCPVKAVILISRDIVGEPI